MAKAAWHTVYLACDRKHDRPVALKVLGPKLAAALGAERFLREIAVTARLQHPHILPLLDSGGAEALLYYTIRGWKGRRCGSGSTASNNCRWMTHWQSRRTWRRPHSHGILHRDIKSENILLTGRHCTKCVAHMGWIVTPPDELLHNAPGSNVVRMINGWTWLSSGIGSPATKPGSAVPDEVPMDLIPDHNKRRKLIQWTVAYLAGAWLVMQVMDVLGDRWPIPLLAQRAIDLFLVIIAWYGEKGRQHVSGSELLLLALLLCVDGLPGRPPAKGASEPCRS